MGVSEWIGYAPGVCWGKTSHGLKGLKRRDILGAQTGLLNFWDISMIFHFQKRFAKVVLSFVP